MFPALSIDEFMQMPESCTVDELINKFHETDPLYKCAQKVPRDNGCLWVACHGSRDGYFGTIIFNEYGEIDRTDLISTNKMANIIMQSNLWFGQDIVFLACHAGVPGGAAEQTATQLRILSPYNDFCIYAPLQSLYISKSGFYYVSEERVASVRDSTLDEDIQNQRWAIY